MKALAAAPLVASSEALPSKPVRTLALCLILLVLSPPAFAQLRTIPPDAERGHIRHVQEMIVAVDGRNARLAPGATIRNQQNMVIVPMSLPQDGAVAEYQMDAQGQISRVWLLTAEEAKRPRKPRPRR